MANEWELPQGRTHIPLDRDELLVLDWHLSGHYLCNVGHGPDIDEVIKSWHELRTAVWNGILEVAGPGNAGASPPNAGHILWHRLPMDEGTAKYLFNWLPPTFMWGTGRDCGFTLKIKLHNFLAGEEEEEITYDNPDTTQSSATNASNSDA